MTIVTSNPRDFRIRFLLIVTASRGIIIRDKPLPEGLGGKEIRRVPAGSQEYAYGIHSVGGVPYAHIVSTNPASTRQEWARVQELDGSVKYVDIVRLDDAVDIDPVDEAIRAAGSDIAEAIRGAGIAIAAALKTR